MRAISRGGPRRNRSWFRAGPWSCIASSNPGGARSPPTGIRSESSRPDSLVGQSLKRPNCTREARGALRRPLGIPVMAREDRNSAHVLRADRATAPPSWRDGAPNLQPARAPACVHEVEFCILQIVRSIRQSIPVHGEDLGEPHRVGEHPALHGPNRNAQARSWRDAAREQATDQSWRTLFSVEVAQDQPIHVSRGPRQTRNPLIEPRHASGHDRPVWSVAHVSDQPFGDRDIRVALDSEVDERHALAS